MKVAMLCPATPRSYIGGLGEYAMKISKRLIDRGFEVEIFTTAAEPKKGLLINGVPVREFPAFAPKQSYFLSPELFLALRKENFDLIHCNGYNNLVTFFGILAKKPKQKLVVTLNSSVSSSYFRKILRIPYAFLINLLKDRMDKVICSSDYEYNVFSERILLPKKRFTIIPNGVDIDFIKGIKVNKKNNTIISIGRLVKNNGFHHLIRGFKLLTKTNPAVHLDIVGSGPYENALRKLTKELKIEDRISFLGTIPFNKREKLIKLLKQSTLFVLLSDYEGTPLTFLHALAAKVPMLIVANKKVIMAEYVRKDYAVGVENPSDPKEVSKKMRIILKNPEKFVPENAGLTDWNSVTKRIEEVYEEIC